MRTDRYDPAPGQRALSLNQNRQTLPPLVDTSNLRARKTEATMLNCESDPAPRRKTWRRWPPEALELVRQNKPPAALCEELLSLTGNDRRACWRFLNKHGIKRPGSGSRRKFDARTSDALVEYISDHGVQEAARRFGYEAKSLYNLLYRQEHTRLSKDAMSLRQVCAYLRVKHSQAARWIESGLLEAVRRESRTGAVTYLIEFQSLQKFCRDHRNLLVTRRSSPNRIRFLEEYIFAPKHAELLRTRESKREAEAFERGEYQERTTPEQKTA